MKNLKHPKTNNFKTLSMASIGAMFECYDFMICVFLASYLMKIFFAGNSLLGIFAIFTIAFFTRPLGGIFWSHLGDKYGRKLVFSISMASMIIPTLAIAIFPTHISPTLNTYGFILLRALQGFLVGGEFSGGVTFIAEIAPKNKRGAWVAFFMAVLTVGTLLASGVNLALQYLLDSKSILEWGWRIPFVFSIFLVLVSIYIRSMVQETDLFSKAVKNQQIIKLPLLNLLTNNLSLVISGFIITCCSATGLTTLYTFLPQILKTIQGINQTHILYLTTIGLTVLCVLMPVFGFLSDKLGRRNLFLAGMLGSTFGFAMFRFGLQYANFNLLLIAMIISSIAFAAVNGIYCVAISELFPTNIRFTGVAISYTLGYSICGGLLPIIYLKHMTETKTFLLPTLTIGLFTILYALICWPKHSNHHLRELPN